MKLVCLDRDSCAESYYLNNKELSSLNLNEKFHKCRACNKVAILVNDNFKLDQNEFRPYKIIEKVKKK